MFRLKALASVAMAGMLALTACQAEEEATPTTAAPTAAPTTGPAATRPAGTATAAATPTRAAGSPTAAATAAGTPTASAAGTAVATQAPAGTMMVKLLAVAGSGQQGTATLTAKGAQTEVVLDITPGAAGVDQPAHLHDTECQSPPKVIHRLTNVAGGKSTTTLTVALTELQSKPLAVCVHKSAAEAQIYVSAGIVPGAKSFEAGIENFRHVNITVPAGTTVGWVNVDSTSHTVTAGKDGAHDGKGFNSLDLAAGRVFRQTFSETGTFTYTCRIHPTMNATVTVTAGGSSSSSSSGTPSSSDPYEY